jgi:hypothetical protein
VLGIADPVGKRLLEILPASAGAKFSDKFRALAKGDPASSFEAYFARSDNGGRFQVRIFPNAEGIAVLFQPHTDDGIASRDGELQGRRSE